MEFDNVCTIIQGNLRSLEKSIGVKLSDINADHDDAVKQVTDLLGKVIKEFSIGEDKLRIVHMLLLLNSKWEHMSYFEEEKNFCHFLNCVPQLSKYLYFKVVTMMEWCQFLGEVVLHFPEFLVREILLSVDADLKHIQPQNGIPFFYHILSNLFHKMMYLQEHCRHRMTEFLKIFLTLVQFNFEDLVNEMDVSVEKKYHYWGHLYRMLLDLTCCCIDRLVSFDIPENEYYKNSCDFNYAVWPCVDLTTCRGKHCLGKLANMCLAVSDYITVHMYMSWTEVDVMEDVVEKTLQTCVRESAYKTRSAIGEIPQFHITVDGLKVLHKRLGEIEVKPTTEDDEIAAADADTILMNLLNPKKSQAKWLRGLINIGIFESAPHMKVVSENAFLVDKETMTLLLNSAVKFLSNNSVEEENHELIRSTLKTCLKALPTDSQLSVLAKFTKDFGLSSPLQSPTFVTRATLLFNRVVAEGENNDEMYPEMVWLAIENVELIFKRAFNECMSSRQKAALILDLVKFVAPAADIVSPRTNLSFSIDQILVIMKTVRSLEMEKLESDFLHMLEVAAELNIINSENFVYTHVVPELEQAVSESSLDSILFYLNIISALESTAKPSQVKYLALLIKILNRFRPRINKFTMKFVEITTTCIELLECALTNLKDKSENDIGWLKSLAEKVPSLTGMYLSPLILSDLKDAERPFDKSLFWSRRGLGQGKYLAELESKDRAELVTSTLKVLPSLTMKEWERIGGGTSADFDNISATYFVLVDCLLVLLQVPAVIQNIGCFGNILTNFIHFTKSILVPKLKSKKGQEALTLISSRIDCLTSELPEELVESKQPHLVHLQQIVSECKKTKSEVSVPSPQPAEDASSY